MVAVWMKISGEKGLGEIIGTAKAYLACHLTVASTCFSQEASFLLGGSVYMIQTLLNLSSSQSHNLALTAPLQQS